MNKKHPDVDLVYLWVNGNDSEWINKKLNATGLVHDNTEENCKGRYFENDELRYSIRSIEKFANWIRRIYIVTDNQIPEWLDTSNERIKIVNHTDILPPESLPCFNAVVIEHYIYKINGLSEAFLYANDDMFLNKKLTYSFFFDHNGLPFVRLKRKSFGKLRLLIRTLLGLHIGQYRQMIIEAAQLVEHKFSKYYSGVPHHNIDAYLKSDYQYAVEKVFKQEVELTRTNKVRQKNDINRAAFSLYALAINKASLVYVRRNNSSRLLPNKHNLKKYLKRHDPEVFCINDSQRVTDEQRAMIKPFLASLFPTKSSYEK